MSPSTVAFVQSPIIRVYTRLANPVTIKLPTLSIEIHILGKIGVAVQP